MRITLEPTSEMLEHKQHKVIVETKYDDLNIEEVIQLISNALVSYGFARQNVTDFFEEIAN